MQSDTPRITAIIITEVIPAVSELSNSVMSEAAMQFWKVSLEDLSAEQLRNGVTRIGREHKDSWKMTPAQFREYCTTAQGESIEDEASQAFNEMMKFRYVRRYNAYFKNHITAQVIRQMGAEYDSYNDQNLAFKKKDFIQDYKVLKTRGEQYDQFILLPEDNWNRKDQPKLVGFFNDEEKENIRLEFSQLKQKELTGKILTTLGITEKETSNKVKDQVLTNKMGIQNCLINLKGG